MSSNRKRRYAQRLENQRSAQQQVAIMESWNASVLRMVHLLMLYPKYDSQKLLTYQSKGTNEQ